MVATPNKSLEQPARGTLVGVWDTPVNANMDIIDASLGGAAAIALTNSPVVLSSAQYRNIFITFTGALSGNCAITFPTVGSIYTIQNLTSNTSAFQVTLQTTAAGSQVIGAPWGEAFDIMTDASGNVKFRNLERVGAFWDFGGSSVPSWVSNCTIPPYLNCDGTTFSSATYPVLTTILAGTTLPDARGRFRATLNQGQSRITTGSSTGGLDGNTNLSGGGSQTTTLSSQNIPPSPVTETAHEHTMFSSAIANNTNQFYSNGATSSGIPAASLDVGFDQNYNISTVTAAQTSNKGRTGATLTSVSVGSSSPTNFSNIPPAYIAGLTFIRAG